MPQDIGPIHVDRWFWDINSDWLMPIGTKRRFKIWVSLHNEPCKNGLNVVTGSHLHDKYNYSTIQSGNKFKPVITTPVPPSDITLIPSEPGDIILFDDSLLHGGAYNIGQYPRVSFEFTCCIP